MITPKRTDYWDPGLFSATEIDELLSQNSHPALLLVRDKVWQNSTSYLGGFPQLPADLRWPTNPKTGDALHFLAQIDCATLAKIPNSSLPSSGTLFFFYDFNFFPELHYTARTEFPESCVLYTAQNVNGVAPANATLKGMQGLASKKQFLKWSISSHSVMTYRSSEDPFTKIGNSDYVDAARDATLKELAIYVGTSNSHNKAHMMLGTNRWDAGNTTYGQGMRLLRLCTVQDIGMMFGDCGVIDYWIDPMDLKNLNFDSAYALIV